MEINVLGVNSMLHHFSMQCFQLAGYWQLDTLLPLYIMYTLDYVANYVLCICVEILHLLECIVNFKSHSSCWIRKIKNQVQLKNFSKYRISVMLYLTLLLAFSNSPHIYQYSMNM